MKKLFCILAVLLLLSVMAPAAYADAWFPAEDDMNEALISSPYTNGDCYALNVFLSNYAEMAMKDIDANTPLNSCISGLLKHFELNPTVYPNDVTSFLASDGSRYMQISGSKYEERMWDLFGRSASATDHPGYSNGVITVSAENYGAALTVYASAVSCYIMGENLYSVEFEIYNCTDSSFKGRYETANCNLPENRGTRIATGNALFYFYGGAAVTSFQVSDFTLMQYTLWEVTGEFPYTNNNRPYESSPVTEEPTQAETQQPSASQSEPANESTTESTGPAEPTEASEYNAAAEKEASTGKDKRPDLPINAIIWAVAITLISVIVLITILLLFRMKQKNKKM